MKIEQLYTKCLAQGAYYIESEGEVAIIDPLREVDQYVEMAKANGANIKYIFETHFHADFVSGHVTLAEMTGAEIIYGPNAETIFKTTIAKDEEVFHLGNLKIQVLHTPGHTMESTCYLLKDENEKNVALFSGDTLFLGDVGRPDLAQKAASMTKEDLAGMLFDSLRNKIMPLEDSLTIYPGHGAGSACGKNMMTETVDTLGNQKKVNYALRADMTKEEFVKELTTDLAAPPAYFPHNVAMNKGGYNSISEVISKSKKALSVAQFEQHAAQDDVVILDVRHQNDFVEGFIPGSIFIGIDGGFAPWVGAILEDVKTNILLVCDKNRVDEVLTRLSRVGFDNTIGYLDGGISAWTKAGKELDTIKSVSAAEMEQTLKENPSFNIVDVRKQGEFDNGHLEHAVLLPLSELRSSLDDITEDEACFVHCAGGYRSVIATSIMKAEGLNNMIDVKGGFGAIRETSLPILTETAACPNS